MWLQMQTVLLMFCYQAATALTLLLCVLFVKSKNLEVWILTACWWQMLDSHCRNEEKLNWQILIVSSDVFFFHIIFLSLSSTSSSYLFSTISFSYFLSTLFSSNCFFFSFDKTYRTVKIFQDPVSHGKLFNFHKGEEKIKPPKNWRRSLRVMTHMGLSC